MEKIQLLWNQLLTSGVELGKHILAAIAIYTIGHFLIRLLNKMLQRLMNRRTLDAEVRSFFTSAVSIGLNVLLIIAVISALGIETTSFAALLASAGVAIGMALSGQMQNLAGGVMILIQRPYRIGDFIDTCGTQGTVTSIQIFTTKLLTPDNKVVVVPNGSISSNTLINFSSEQNRRIDIDINVEYGTDVDKVRQVLMDIVKADAQIMIDPEPAIYLSDLGENGISVKLRFWVASENYWDAYFRTRENVYKEFRHHEISFPFPQLTVHQA